MCVNTKTRCSHVQFKNRLKTQCRHSFETRALRFFFQAGAVIIRDDRQVVSTGYIDRQEPADVDERNRDHYGILHSNFEHSNKVVIQVTLYILNMLLKLEGKEVANTQIGMRLKYMRTVSV